MTIRPLTTFYYALFNLLYSTMLMASTEDIPWPNDELDIIEQVNEGTLNFLTKAPAKPVLHAINTFTISPKSIETGWVQLQQCYRHLDQITKSVIVYQYKFMRKFQLVSKRNIGAVTLKDQSAELTDVGQDAELCISAETRNFYQNPDLSFSLVNGPYHRRFLDGFYPYRLTLHVIFTDTGLQTVKTQPQAQAGFSINQQQDRLLIETLFEGMLNIEINFRLISTSK